MKISFFSKFFIAITIVTLASLLCVWFIVRPKYEASVIADRLATIRQLQNYSVDNIDRSITSWSHVTIFISGQVTERPKEGEIILRSMMMLHPEIIQIKIHSSNLSDELASQNTSYPAFNLQVNNNEWISSKIDTNLRVAWVKDSLQHQLYFIEQTQFQVQKIPFVLTVVWDSKRLNDIVAGIPIGQDYSICVQSPSAVLMQNQTSFNLIEAYNTQNNSDTLKSVQQGIYRWFVLDKTFQSVQLRMVVAVPEKNITKSVEDLMLYSAYIIVGLMCIVLIIGVLLSFSIKRQIKKIKIDTTDMAEQ